MNKQDAPARIEAKTERPAHPSRQFFPLKEKLPRGGSRSRTGFAERHLRDRRIRTSEMCSCGSLSVYPKSLSTRLHSQLPLRERAPTPPRFIGHRTSSSRIGLRPKRLGMRVFARSTIEPQLFLGRPLARNRIAIADGRGQSRHQPEVDAMGVDDDAARGRLPKDLVSRTTRIASALMMFASPCPGTDRRQLIDVVADDKKRGFAGGSPRPSAIRYGLRPLPRRAKSRSSPSSRCQPSSPMASERS